MKLLAVVDHTEDGVSARVYPALIRNEHPLASVHGSFNAVFLHAEYADDLMFYGRGAGWQRQLHIYECPFYYIDYCLSPMAALQFFLLSLKDHKDAWERYLKLVRRAGLASYTELMQTAGLKVPFEDGSIKAIAQQMGQWIAEHQV